MAELSKIQMGLEAVAGTAVPATHIWDGGGSLEFLEEIKTPRYTTGIAGMTVENSFVGGTGSRLTLRDTYCSYQNLTYLLNTGIKAIVGPATSFNFTFPTTAENTLSTFTWEVVLARMLQEYEFAYGFASKIGFHADAEEEGGVAQCNAVIEGRAATASTVTASLAVIPSREMMNIRNASFKIDALGTAAGTAAATTGTLRGFSLDIETGWKPKAYADSRSAKDFSVPEGGVTYKLTGKLRLYKNATAVTHIANARTAAPKVIQVGFIGTDTLRCNFNLPLIYLSAPKDDTDTDYLEYDYEAGYSSTATAQGPAIAITLASTTIT